MLGRERPSANICDSLAVNRGGKYHYQRTFDVS